MTLPESLVVVRCLVRDTFRQSLASRSFWLILGLTALAVVFCLGVSVSGDTYERVPGDKELYRAEKPGELGLAFGLIRLQVTRTAADEVVFLQKVLALGAGGALGMLLMVMWTSGFLPEFLEPHAVSVLLVKPVPRGLLLGAKIAGVLTFVAGQLTLFVVGTWAALGLKTGQWPAAYLLAAPLLVLEFAIVYSFAALLAVLTRSTVVCLFGAVVFWLVCAALGYERGSIAAAAPGAEGGSRLATPWLHGVYWVLPKPGDPVQLLEEGR